MNQKAIKKYFEKSWKKNRIIIARTRDGKLWLCDNNVLIAANEDNPVFNSSRMLSNLPLAPGTSSWASQSDISNMGEAPNVQALIDRALNALKDDYKPLVVTDWHKFSNPFYLQLLKTQDEQEIFINADLLNLIDGPKKNISEYQFFGTKPDCIVLVKNKENELVAMIMPFLL